jgi:hypothetical protein
MVSGRVEKSGIEGLGPIACGNKVVDAYLELVGDHGEHGGFQDVFHTSVSRGHGRDTGE